MRSLRKTLLLLAAIATAAVALAGCGDWTAQNNGSDQTLTLTGSSTVAPLAAEIATRFEAQNPGVRIDVQTGGSSRGVADTRRGLADIGMASRRLHPEEAEVLQAHTIAYDGIGIILHRDNLVRELTREQVVAIYTGKTRNWAELGGPDRTITVVNKSASHSTLELFLDHFDLENAQVEADTIIGDNEQGVKTVAGTPGAIGYVSIGAAEYHIEAGTPIRLLGLGGVKASSANVASEAYPLLRPLNLLSKGEPQGLAKRFIAFARSGAVAATVKEQYFVPPGS